MPGGRRLRVLLVSAILSIAAACGGPEEPIEIRDGLLRVRNLTESDWHDVRIWVNDHYSGFAKLIPAGGFVSEPLTRFVASRGQPFDPVRTPVTSVVVLARNDEGTRVRVAWGTPALH